MARTTTSKAVGHWVKDPNWRGGRVWQDADGRRTFHIRRTVGGVTHEISTGCSTLAAAIAHLERFERDPDGYKASLAAAEPVLLDEKRVARFLAWSLDPKNGKGNTPGWARKQQRLLGWWADWIGDTDLRRVSLRDHVMPALDGATDRASRIRVIKAFYAWCRKEDQSIKAHEDPTFGTLSAPAAKPAQRVKSKVIPREHYLLVRDAIVDPWRSALIVQAGSGWHISELVRFAAAGSVEPLPPSMRVGNGAVAVLVVPLHKSGDMHRTAVSQEVLDAATRLRAYGDRMAKEGRVSGEKPARARTAFDAFPDKYAKAIKSACRSVKCPDGRAGIPVFTPGHFRHSVATWAYESGTDLAAISAFLGHKSPATTKKFYATLATAPKVPTLA